MTIVSYQLIYPALTSKCKRLQPRGYGSCLILRMVNEIENGFYPKKIYPSTSKGTKVTYCKTVNIEMINEFISQHNERCGTKIPSIKHL